ncbi:NAD-dependent DNA ligase LigA, partial [Streptomyces scabiei]
GRLTPVATVDPVKLVGATVTRASIYNLSYIEELGLDIGATVLVARANDVIPRIEELVKGTGKTAKAPSHCPECGGFLK